MTRLTRMTPAARAVVLALLATSLTALGVSTASPAGADDACQQELPEPLLPPLPFPTSTCDDDTPPVTDPPTMSPVANTLGYVQSETVTLTLASHYAVADPDPVGYQCQFWNSDDQTGPDPTSGTWTTCAKPGETTYTVSDLADSKTGAYHLRVRAVDAGDSDPLRIVTTGDDTPDYDHDFDAVIQELSFRVDSTDPNTFLTGAPTDSVRPDFPTVLTRTPTFTLVTNEPDVAGFVCTVNQRRIPCHGGPLTLPPLPTGKVTFKAAAVDRAGNYDHVPVSIVFSVPRNLTLDMAADLGRSCSRLEKPGFFDGDALVCSKPGAQVHFASTSQRVRELRLVAPVGPRLGQVEVSIGEGKWYTVDLYSPRPSRMKVFVVRDQYETPKGGQIRIRVKQVSEARPVVRIDAVIAR